MNFLGAALAGAGHPLYLPKDSKLFEYHLEDVR